MLKNSLKMLIFAVMLTTFSLNAQAQVGRLKKRPAYFILDLRPGGLLFSSELDGFETERISGGTIYTETISGTASVTPNLRAGVNFDVGNVDIDAMLGAGYIYNDAFEGAFNTAEVAVKFKPGNDHFTIGPHVGLISLHDAEWSGAADIDLQGNSGSFIGISLTAGSKIVSFHASFDYVNVAYDVRVNDLYWTVSDSELDMSGVWLNLGVLFRF